MLLIKCKKWDGLGDKNEEYGEKWHQLQKTLTLLTNHMASGSPDEISTQFKTMWRNSDTEMQKVLGEVMRLTSRKHKNGTGTLYVRTGGLNIMWSVRIKSTYLLCQQTSKEACPRALIVQLSGVKVAQVDAAFQQ